MKKIFLTAVLTSLIFSLPLRADSFMSSKTFAPVMQWNGLRQEECDLGGIKSPMNSVSALSWLDAHPDLDPSRKFLAAYKAMWDGAASKVRSARLLGWMQRAKSEATSIGSDGGGLGVMALGLSVATLQAEIFSEPELAGTNRALWDKVTPAKISAAALFSEAIALDQTLTTGGTTGKSALRKALRSAWKYAQEYVGVAEAFKQGVPPDRITFLMSEELDEVH